MLKSSELRIGNWVHLPSKGKDYQILSGHDIEEIEDSDDAEPITLTTEWLSRFGFEQRALGSWVKSITIFGNLRELSFSGDYLYLREGKEVFGSGEDDLCVIWNKDVMKQFYIHQLQNLYLALTGQELELVTTLQHS